MVSVVRNDWILRDRTVTTVAGCVVPGLRFYLESEAVVKVMHWCSNDAVVLSHYGIVLASAWDTAHGDSIPDGPRTALWQGARARGGHGALGTGIRCSRR